jgi:hypothetical protein
MKIVWNTLAIDIELVPILKHPNGFTLKSPPHLPSLSFMNST